jgi:nucleotide-binding universal stress UspA family protein
MTEPGYSLPVYQSLLVPLDGSDRAEAALPHAAAIAQRCGARIVLYAGVQNPMVVSPEAVGPIPGLVAPSVPSAETLEMAEQARDATVAYLAHHAGELQALGIPVTTSIGEGVDVADQILEVAQGEGIDLIVMTTHGRTGLSRLLFGSVAESVLRRAGVPVLLIRTVEGE